MTYHSATKVTGLFADYFSSVFTNKLINHLLYMEDYLNNTFISTIKINDDITFKYPSSIDIQKGPAIDGYPKSLYATIVNMSAFRLCHL